MTLFKDMAEKEFSFSTAFSALCTDLPQRSRDIIASRFGIDAARALTLEAIGKKYGITRERVRQIVQGSIESVCAKKDSAYFRMAEKKMEETLAKNSGIMKEEDFFARMSGGDTKEEAMARFFFLCMPQVMTDENTVMERAAMGKDFDRTFWRTIVESGKTFLTKSGKTVSADTLFSHVFRTIPIDDKRFFDFLSVSREIKRNVFGKWGLLHWSDIAPKGMREKAYLVLREQGEPMYFRDIAEAINRHGLTKGSRVAHPQTVHNELIKDQRCVLVGRGYYALAAWGYRDGTVRDVLEEILRASAVPIRREEILRRVLEKRRVKKSTVMINLNTFFEKVGHDSYTARHS